mmetsp:Transcript_8625/g.10652  ORF Transcript_8625/g.10652 Transcript_8625/m.10652 type:complete len:203 (+) Transcript_8625:634-1242(+)
MHRTGSTLLQNLLAQDPRTRTTRTWEMMDPVPPVTSKSEIFSNKRIAEVDKKFAQADLICKGWYRSFIRMHYISARNPEEDVLVLFMPFAFWYINYMLHFADNELPGLLRERASYLCRFLHLYLKVLDSSCPPESHWVLKNPDDSQYLPSFLKEFPEANVVVTHRDPTSVVGSWAQMSLLSQHTYIYNDSKEVSRVHGKNVS